MSATNVGMRLAVIAAAATLPFAAGTSPASQPGEAAGSGFEQLLGQLPAAALDADGAMLMYVDMTVVWDRLGVRDDPDERLDNLGRTGLVESWSFVPQMFDAYVAQVDEARAEVGFSALEIDREVAVLAPPRRVVIAATTVPASDVVAAIESDPVWSPDLEEAVTESGRYWHWGGEDFEIHADRRSPLRPLGRGGQLAILDEEPATVIRTIAARDMAATQQAAAGAVPSALDTGPLADALATFHGATVVQAIGVTEPGGGPPPNVTREQLEQLLADESSFVLPYTGLLVAELTDGESFWVEALLVHPAPQVAAANAERVITFLRDGTDMVSRRPIAELLPAATVDGSGTVVRVTVDDPAAFRVLVQMLQQRALFPVG